MTQLPPPSAGLPTLPDSVRFAAALGQFSQSMSRFSALQEKTSTRLSQVIRMGMGALVVLFVAVFLMLMVMADRINLMVNNVAAINAHFHQMVPDISRMHGYMLKMQTNMVSIEDMPQEISYMLSSLDDIHGEMQKIQTHLYTMNQQTYNMAGKTEVIVQQIQEMEQPVTTMQEDIRQVSRPMRIFNKMMPGR
jgi:hypothetical protein